MSILSRIGWGIWDGLTSIGYRIKGALTALFGKPPKAVPKGVPKALTKADANAELRKQWLEVGDKRQFEEPSVEYEGEIYFETVR